ESFGHLTQAWHQEDTSHQLTGLQVIHYMQTAWETGTKITYQQHGLHQEKKHLKFYKKNLNCKKLYSLWAMTHFQNQKRVYWILQDQLEKTIYNRAHMTM